MQHVDLDAISRDYHSKSAECESWGERVLWHKEKLQAFLKVDVYHLITHLKRNAQHISGGHFLFINAFICNSEFSVSSIMLLRKNYCNISPYTSLHSMTNTYLSQQRFSPWPSVKAYQDNSNETPQPFDWASSHLSYYFVD